MISDKDKIVHKTLLKEIHLVDNLLEKHANIMIALISGMFFFFFNIRSKIAMQILSILGFIVSFEFFCHTYRLRDIAINANRRLIQLEKKIGIDTTRKQTTLWKIKFPTGSTLILCISLVFMVIWVLIILLVYTGIYEF